MVAPAEDATVLSTKSIKLGLVTSSSPLRGKTIKRLKNSTNSLPWYFIACFPAFSKKVKSGVKCSGLEYLYSANTE